MFYFYLKLTEYRLKDQYSYFGCTHFVNICIELFFSSRGSRSLVCKILASIGLFVKELHVKVSPPLGQRNIKCFLNSVTIR